MKIGDMVNEVFDVSKMRQAAEIQKSVAKLNDFVAKNPNAAKDIAAEPTQINSNFQAILASIMAQQKQEEEEKKAKDLEDARKAKVMAKPSGIGSTIPVTSVQSGQQGTSSTVQK